VEELDGCRDGELLEVKKTRGRIFIRGLAFDQAKRLASLGKQMMAIAVRSIMN
jgi:hypothetical protein